MPVIRSARVVGHRAVGHLSRVIGAAGVPRFPSNHEGEMID